VKKIAVDNLSELERALAPYGTTFLFRGQTKEYTLSDGLPNITSSFVRKGCIPPLMLKWIFYTDELLRRGGLDLKRPDLLPLTQGLLQHYGWRSFYVDLSSDASVAAWFASYAFQANPELHLCENTSEQPVWVKLLGASYKPSEETGHLYVFDKELLRTFGHTLVSLEDELTTDCPSRFQTQKAWLASIFLDQRRLDPRSIAAHITAPADIFRALAKSAGFQTTNDVFPPPEDDKLLANLLNLPLHLIDVPNPLFPAYSRSLEIPEYQETIPKHLPPTTALYSPFWLSDVLDNNQNEVCLHVPEEIFYASIQIGAPIPRICEYIRQSDVTNIETNELICYPAIPHTTTYEKGISIRKDQGNLYDVCGITVDYAGNELVGAGGSEGYRYELIGDQLIRRPSPTDCSCGDPDRHTLHLRAIAALDEMLKTAKTERDGHIIRVHAA
jgi:hypothetical protein